jgi:hypothetical protein
MTQLSGLIAGHRRADRRPVETRLDNGADD